MNLKALRDAVRSDLRDTIGPDCDKYWKDAEINGDLNEASNILCRSTKIIIDSLTASICTIAVDIGTQHVPISPLIIDINRAKSTWSSALLVAATVKELDTYDSEWEGKSGIPTKFATDYSNGYLTFNRKASATGTVKLTVRRLPLKDMIADSDEPEFNPAYHWMLKDYALYRAFMRQDSEVYRPEKAEKHRLLFMGNDETSPGGHVLRVLTELDQLPNRRPVNFL
jgi:hypothetical protein